MTTEKLILCAKALGYEPTIRKASLERFVPKGSEVVVIFNSIRFNPYTNDAQAMELLRWLIAGDKYWIDLQLANDGKYYAEMMGLRVEGQTLNEAIINAVVAMEESK